MRVWAIAVVLFVAAGMTTGEFASAVAGRSESGPVADAASHTVVSAPVAKVLVFIEENHSYSQVRAGMPYLFSQSVKYGYADNYYALSHPSLPNYLGISSGDTFGIADDKYPVKHPIAPPDVFTAALTAGHTAKAYQESMPSPCYTANSGRYAVRHNPWAYVPSERGKCLANDVPTGTVTSGALHDAIVNGALPTVGEVTPNLDNDAHDGSLATADAWLRNWLTLIYSSPDWKSGHLAVLITADEAGHGDPVNKVLTTVLHPSQAGHVAHTALNHYAITRLLTRVSHAPCIRNGCTAADLATAFGLPIG